MAETIRQTIDLGEASEKVHAFVLKGYPDLKPLLHQKGVYAHRYEPDSPSKGPISQELLPIQVRYFTGENVIVGGDPAGHHITVKPVFATAAAGFLVIEKSPEPVAAAPMVLPPVVDTHHPQPAARP